MMPSFRFLDILLLSLVLLVAAMASVAEPNHEDATATAITITTSMPMMILLRTELCQDFCTGIDCITYETPINTCFNGASLFHHSVDWGNVDIWDEISMVDPSLFTRRFYTSNDTTCKDLVDTYELPFDECLGPFGKPHPWGRLTLVNDDKRNYDKNTLESSVE